MPIYADMVQRIRRFFTRQQVADIAAIKEAVGTSSRTTVFRLLSKIGYQTSYSHAGGYYTLRDIPKFDGDGLWSCRGALFSKRRTLRATVLDKVDTASAGHTDQELQARLGLRVRDTLLDLVQVKQIGRRSLERFYLYVSADHQKAQAQFAQRQRLLSSQRPPTPLPDTGLVIEVLLAVINQPKADPAAVVSILRRQGRAISREQVEAVFARYDLGKKKLPRHARKGESASAAASGREPPPRSEHRGGHRLRG
jgi:hypothetical protein